MEFISDEDARAEGGAHPRAHLWDSGGNAVDELDRIMKIRERALARFGVNNIRPGAAMSTVPAGSIATNTLGLLARW